MIKVLLTGSSGFVASNLYDALHQEFELYGLDITEKGKFPKERIFGWDQLDSLPATEVIIHLAGKAHDTKNISEEAEYFEVNSGLTQKIFDHFLRSEAQKFFFFSSVKAVADTVEGEILTEETVPDPKTPYGKSKLAAEQYILSKSIPEDKMVYILRPSMIHGRGNKGNLNLLYQVVTKNIPWPLGAFDNRRSFLSTGNLSFIINQLISNNIRSGIYNIADDEPLSTNELISLIAASSGRKARIMKMPRKFIGFIAKSGDFLRLPLNSERLKKLTENYVVSNSKIKEALNIRSLPLTAREGMKNTLDSFATDTKKQIKKPV